MQIEIHCDDEDFFCAGYINDFEIVLLTGGSDLLSRSHSQGTVLHASNTCLKLENLVLYITFYPCREDTKLSATLIYLDTGK